MLSDLGCGRDWSYAISADGLWLAATSPLARSVHIYDIDSGARVRTIVLENTIDPNALNARPFLWSQERIKLLFSSDGSILAVAHRGVGKRKTDGLLVHHASGHAMPFSPDGSTFCAFSPDNTRFVYQTDHFFSAYTVMDTRTGVCLGRLTMWAAGFETAGILFSLDGARLAVMYRGAFNRCAAAMWSVDTGKEWPLFLPLTHDHVKGLFLNVVFDHGSRLLALFSHVEQGLAVRETITQTTIFWCPMDKNHDQFRATVLQTLHVVVHRGRRLHVVDISTGQTVRVVQSAESVESDDMMSKEMLLATAADGSVMLTQRTDDAKMILHKPLARRVSVLMLLSGQRALPEVIRDMICD
jgi:hypothetical protein